MTWGKRTKIPGVCFLLVFSVALIRSTGKLPHRDQIAQWWLHLGSGISLAEGEHPLVFLITGQSNAGNYGAGTRREAGPGVYNAYQGKLYFARDPLLGSDALGVSQWIRFAETLLHQKMARSVVLALAVRGGMDVTSWSSGRPMRTELFARIAELHTLGLTPDYVLWQQGETDALSRRLNPEEYADAVRGLLDSLRQAGVSAPVLVAQATRSQDVPPYLPIRAAQLSLVDPVRLIFRGPDTDRLGPEFRRDGVHFSETGIAALAQVWVDAVKTTARQSTSPAGTAAGNPVRPPSNPSPTY